MSCCVHAARLHQNRLLCQPLHRHSGACRYWSQQHRSSWMFGSSQTSEGTARLMAPCEENPLRSPSRRGFFAFPPSFHGGRAVAFSAVDPSTLGLGPVACHRDRGWRRRRPPQPPGAGGRNTSPRRSAVPLHHRAAPHCAEPHRSEPHRTAVRRAAVAVAPDRAEPHRTALHRAAPHCPAPSRGRRRVPPVAERAQRDEARDPSSRRCAPRSGTEIRHPRRDRDNRRSLHRSGRDDRGPRSPGR
ncbi:MAG: hypothetical protein K0Q58_727 [Microbacterium sp.]|jgi:hypothetical protein|nr:hypothetical protein [Microbacterium sp.]